jgi:hypothetical protein
MSIPIAQVPNAPKTGLTQLSRFSGGATPFNPNAGPKANLGVAAAAMGNVDSLLQQPNQPVEAFGGASGEALARLGESGQRAAAVLADWNLSMTKANDEGNLARANRYVIEAKAAFDVEASRLPPDQRLSTWNEKYVPKLEKQLGEIPLSNTGRARFTPWWEGTKTEAAAEIYVKANKDTINNGRMEIDTNIEHDANNGNVEGAMGWIARGVSSRLFSPEEGKVREVKLAEVQKDNTTKAAISKNPAKMRRVLAKAEQDGTNTYGWRPEQVIQYRALADAKHSQLVGSLANEVLTRLETQSAAIKNDDIEAMFTRPDIDAPRELINSIKKYRGLAYDTTPEGQGAKAQKYGDLWQKIYSYDAAGDQKPKDPTKHMQGYFGLMNDVTATAPEGERKQFLDTLNKRVNDAEKGVSDRADEISKGLIDMTGKLSEWGQFGDEGGWKDVKNGDKTDKVPVDPAKHMAVQQKRIEVTNDIRKMMKDNPDLNEAQAMERFKGILQNRLDGGAMFQKQPDAGSWWEKLIQFIPEGPKTPVSAVFPAQADAKGFTPAIATSFGTMPDGSRDTADNQRGKYAGAATGDPNFMGASLSKAALAAHGIPVDQAGNYDVIVQHNGKQVRVPIADLGPADWVEARQGRTVDLTGAVHRALGMNGKASVSYKVVPRDSQDA